MVHRVHLQSLIVDEVPSVSLGHPPGDAVGKCVLCFEDFCLALVGAFLDVLELRHDLLFDVPSCQRCWFVEVDGNQSLDAGNCNKLRLHRFDLHEKRKRHDGDLHMKYLSDVKVPHTPPTKRRPEMYSTENDMKWFYKSRLTQASERKPKSKWLLSVTT